MFFFPSNSMRAIRNQPSDCRTNGRVAHRVCLQNKEEIEAVRLLSPEIEHTILQTNENKGVNLESKWR